MPWSLRILRAFLGGDVRLRGVQKFLDPEFLHAGSATYIGTQLQGSRRHAGGAADATARAVPFLDGLGVAITEIAVGLAMLLGDRLWWPLGGRAR